MLIERRIQDLEQKMNYMSSVISHFITLPFIEEFRVFMRESCERFRKLEVKFDIKDFDKDDSIFNVYNKQAAFKKVSEFFECGDDVEGNIIEELKERLPRGDR